LTENYNDIKIDMIYNNELKESQVQTIDVTASVAINEDIPSFREWTKKQLEEAEKQPGVKNDLITYNTNTIIYIFFQCHFYVSY